MVLGLSQRLIQRGLCGFEAGFATFELHAADEVLGTQAFIAFVFGLGQVALGASTRHLRLRSLRGQLVVGCIHLCQQGASFHMLAHFGLALRDFSSHPKTQPRLHTGPHFARKFIACRKGTGAYCDHLDCPHRLLNGFGFRTS